MCVCTVSTLPLTHIVIIPVLRPIARPKTQTKLQLASHPELTDDQAKLEHVDLTVNRAEIGAGEVLASQPPVGGVAHEHRLLKTEVVDEEGTGEGAVVWCDGGEENVGH